MTSFAVGQLEMAADAVSISFFCITLLLLIVMTVKHNRTSPKQAVKEDVAGFNEELVQMIKQSEEKDANDLDSGEQNNGGYGNVQRLADLGLGAEEISRRVSIPRSEVELIVRLRKFGLKSGVKNRELKE